MMDHKPVYYGEYLQLDKILNAQDPESGKDGKTMAHDEMLFIIIHQSYELWFKQVLFEVNSIIEIMDKPRVNDNSGDMQAVVHRLNRVVTILRMLVQKIDILDTMTPMDFLDFRDMLRPASGFQSWQFKVLEARLGLKFDNRFGQQYYLSQLNQKEIDIIKNAEKGKSVVQLLNSWLERMPFAEDKKYWPEEHNYWTEYEKIFTGSLSEAEKNNAAFFKHYLFTNDNNAERSLSSKACRSALFIMLYRGYPMLELPFQLLNTLLEVDHQLGNWRYRHINMVRRMIGTRIGTGGSTGADYLQGAMNKHYIFKEISQIGSFLIERRKLPALNESLTKDMGYGF
ncbi:MAG: tryptophan 2,3-dioxygenase [Chitinophagaceae bacterium]|nr:tryptophan 2,3-dioxygenase [Chitinophagaceae bacterium]MBP6045751.1 tryptophan 2,3-dioxygenase [Ferruginibacter sp.]MBK7088089.1 tryptophan 2,3-dioxygenase [Chitinophagaceae bacterium]MBK7346838.1 tryptophan 2,3-dioxygenase [Chitinophagaceae bacterium]MBK8928628.1 tryptophan 2,3-dioxygenase [Chitinophagaceae bacterium]